MIPLMKNTFLYENKTKEELSRFILSCNKFSMGTECIKFEEQFSQFHNRKFGVLFNSGGSANLALLQALKNLGKLKEKDKIGFSALTWSTNVMPIIQMGLEPIPIDVDIKYLNITSNTLKERLREVKLDCLFITNVLGFAGDLDEIKNIANDEGFFLIEDNCESLGSEVNGTLTGNFGMASTFSFFVAHHMSTIEGGMVLTDDKELQNMLKIVRANGWDRNLDKESQFEFRKNFGIPNEFYAKYAFYDLGYNLRPTEITGFLGQIQLKYLKENIDIREKNYLALAEYISNNDELISVERSHMTKISNFSIPVICRNEELFSKYFIQFSGAGIEIRPMIAGNIQNQPFFKKYCNKTYKLKGAEFLHNCSFYCGNYPDLTPEDLSTIINCLRKY